MLTYCSFFMRLAQLSGVFEPLSRHPLEMATSTLGIGCVPTYGHHTKHADEQRHD